MKHRILALRGGGIRGIIPARVLVEIESQTGRPCHELFSMICGTSIGGIMSLALTIPTVNRQGDWAAPDVDAYDVKTRPMTAAEVLDLLTQRGNEIFFRTWAHEFKTLFGLLGPKYSADGLERVLAETFGSAQLTEAIRPVFCTTYDTITRKPLVLSNRCEDEAQHVARATSAAPTYFPPHTCVEVNVTTGERKIVRQFIDGGVFANDPSALALGEAVKLGWDLADVELLTLGTGDSDKALPDASRWGLARWIHPLFDVLLDGNADVAFADARMMRGEHATLIEAKISPDIQALDDCRPSTIKALEAVGAALCQTPEFQRVLAGLRS